MKNNKKTTKSNTTTSNVTTTTTTNVTTLRELKQIIKEEIEKVRDKSSPGVSLHLPGQIDDDVKNTYGKLLRLKHELDQMHEIPKDLQPIYDEIGKALASLASAGANTYQLRMLMRRYLNRRSGN